MLSLWRTMYCQSNQKCLDKRNMFIQPVLIKKQRGDDKEKLIQDILELILDQGAIERQKL